MRLPRRSRVQVDLVPRAATEDLGLAPGDDLLEGVAVDEALEVLFRRPLAENHITADGGDVFVKVGLDVAGDGLEVFKHAEEPALELLLLAGDDLVMHADGGHW